MEKGPDFLKVMQEFCAYDAVGITALRNQGQGVLGATRRYLSDLDLAAVPVVSATAYEQWLDQTTERILDHLQRNLKLRNRPWGTARKALNLFMRACICNHHLRSAYNLERIEPFAEIPLDNKVAKRLRGMRQQGGAVRLCAFTALKRLNRDVHREYQLFAADQATKIKFPARVYLDNYLWLISR